MEESKIMNMIDSVLYRMMCSDIFKCFSFPLLRYEITLVDDCPFTAYVAYYERVVVINKKPLLTMDENEVLLYLVFVLSHEMLHPILLHDERLKNKELPVWWKATDYVINGILYNLSSEPTNNDGCGRKLLNCTTPFYLTNFLFNKKYDNMIEEEVYADLLRNSKTSSSREMFKIKVGNKELELEIVKVKTEINGYTSEKTFVKPTESNISKEEKEKINKQDSETVLLQQQMFKNMILKGELTNSLNQQLKLIFKVELDWRPILNDSIRTILEKSTELVWSRPSIIYLANPKAICYRPTFSDEEKIGNIIFSLDESGSMSNQDCLEAIDITFQSKEHFKGIIVIKHDVEVSWWKYYENADDINADELLIRRTCGGTSHNHVFLFMSDFIRKNPESYISCYIGVTDLYSDISECQHIIPINIPIVYLTKNRHPDPKIKGRIITL